MFCRHRATGLANLHKDGALPLSAICQLKETEQMGFFCPCNGSTLQHLPAW